MPYPANVLMLLMNSNTKSNEFHLDSERIIMESSWIIWKREESNGKPQMNYKEIPKSYKEIGIGKSEGIIEVIR